MSDLILPDTYPHWIYDGSPIEDPDGRGDLAVRFLRAMRHPKSRLPGKAFQLDPWQERVIRRIYGPRNTDGTRVVKTVVLLLPRGNRKTSLSAAIALLHVVGPERVHEGENIFAAADRKQASIAFREALGIAQATPMINAAIKVYDAHNSAKKIEHGKSGGWLEVVSGDAGTQHGRSPVFALVDELHVHRDRNLLETLETGLDKNDDPLLIIATTAGKGQQNIAWEKIEEARAVARGEVDNPTILPVLFEAPRDTDWRDPALWDAVNPGLKHGYPALSGIQRHAARAERSLPERSSFLQLKLNQWAAASTSPFVDMLTYDLGAKPTFNISEFGEDDPCWIGVDCSRTTDLTAVVAVFRRGEDFLVVPKFFVPADDIQTRAERDTAPYVEWADPEVGYIQPTEGNAVDYAAVADYIRHLVAGYDVREIAFDPAYAAPVMAPLQAEGLPVLTMQQGWKTQSPALNTLERSIISGHLKHNGNPVLRWCFENVAIHTDSAGNRTMHKGKSKDRIDGAAATWMAVARAAAYQPDNWLDNADLDIDAFLADDAEFSLD
ncbi:MAG TPA: terminase TerL endonuclease subunit [Devosia sp.]|jgi:phage terminase large subunit-like protein|nr:terminase TerL endonuclease subunit [Devosia sp.]